MTTLTIAQQVSELNERLLVLSRNQARLTWALRGLRTGQAGAEAPPTDVAAPVSPPLVPSRNMLRVAPVVAPHRPTKRNYDYFGRLQAQLAALPPNGTQPR